MQAANTESPNTEASGNSIQTQVPRPAQILLQSWHKDATWEEIPFPFTCLLEALPGNSQGDLVSDKLRSPGWRCGPVERQIRVQVRALLSEIPENPRDWCHPGEATEGSSKWLQMPDNP